MVEALNLEPALVRYEEASAVRDEMVQVKGFFILPSELFGNLLNRIKKADKDAKDKAEKDGKEVEIADLDENLNEILQTNFKNIEASAIGTPSEENFKGLFDDIDVNSNKLGPTVIKRNKRLKKLITVIGDMDLGNYQNNSIDAFGDTYEYLMGMYASNAGKSGGEFFTPQEVSELLTKISLLDNNGKMKTEVNKVYDPAVGSGSLLLKFAKILGKDTPNPFHLIFRLKLLRYSFTFRYLLYQLRKHVLCLPVNFGKMSVQLSACQQVHINNFMALFQISCVSLSPYSDWLTLLFR